MRTGIVVETYTDLRDRSREIRVVFDLTGAVTLGEHPYFLVLGLYPAEQGEAPDYSGREVDRLFLLGVPVMSEPSEPQFGSIGCTCIPYTRKYGTARYCGPRETPADINGWKPHLDCPHHTAADALVVQARRAVHEALVLLPAWEADRVRALIADLETAVEGRTAMRIVVPPASVGTALVRVRALADEIDAEMRTEPDTQRAAMQLEAVTRLRAALSSHPFVAKATD
ncbi:hypothetical protein ACF082_34245 [Streptomyces lydicus]|uniref:hypothetical protein n=1 Tax=Streptomyces lydicus TaxID=47763 RepID=UPI003702FF3A